MVAIILAIGGAATALELVIWLGLGHLMRGGRRRLAVARVVLGVAAPLVLLAAYVGFAPLPSPYDRLPPPGLVVLDADGGLLQRDTSAGLRIPVRLDQVAPIMVDATVAAEDERFRSHPGVDPVATLRSLVALPFHRSGASTLTQQLARRLYLSGYEGALVERKAREALLALQIDARYSKDQILELYLNDVYYGRGAYGVEAAARVYFGVSAANLDLAQAALLAGLPQMPSVYGANPGSQATLARRDYVLSRLAAHGRITSEAGQAAASEVLGLLPEPEATVAPHFVAYALEELGRARPDLAGRQDLIVETTLDSGLQRQSEDIVRYYVGQLKDRDVGNGAAVVIEPASGRVLTMVGSIDFTDAAIAGQYNMAIQPRQPGSALKPFLYLAAFAKGYTAATPLLDVPTSFSTVSGTYTPLDYDRRFNGVVPLRVALASSLNVPAVRTLDDIGIDSFLQLAHRFGLSTLTDTEVYGLALTLGGGEVKLTDLTAAYGTLGNAGASVETHAVERVLDQSGRVLYQHQAAPAFQVVSEQDAFVISDILSDPAARLLGFGDAPQLTLPFTAAVKTGTTTEFRDNWTVGYTPQRAVGVWVGNTDDRPMVDVSGVSGAAPIWRAVMEAAHRGVAPAWRQAPAGMVRATVCAPTGLLPGPYCPSRTAEWFSAGTEPAAAETYYRLDASGRVAIDPPVAARAWAQDAGIAVVQDGEPATQGMVLFPAPGSRFFMAPELVRQSLVLRASVPAGAVSVEFRVDGELVRTAPATDATAVWDVRPGNHLLQVSVISVSGPPASASSSFQVKQ